MDGTTLALLIGVIVIVIIGAFVFLMRRGSSGVVDGQPAPSSHPVTPPSPAKPLRDDMKEGAAPPPPPIPAPHPITPPTPRPTPIISPPAPETDDETTRGIGDMIEKARREELESADEFGDMPSGGVSEGRQQQQQQQPLAAREPVEFTAYYPKEVAPSVWADLLAYAYRVSAADAVKTDAQGTLGAAIGSFRRVARAEQNLVMDEAQITVTPRLAGFQFNPVSATIGFYDVFNRASFKVRAQSAAPGDVHEGAITFAVEGIIVCEIPLYMEVNPNAAAISAMPSRNAPAESPLTAAPPKKAYQAVFCSYSRKDVKIVERVERAYKILGFDYLRDLTTIRPGEDWDSRLLQMIEQADIFQLFWSSASSTSPAVKKEWAKALELAAARPNFIRPVFWEQPMPAPPPELGHINFAFEPTLDD